MLSANLEQNNLLFDYQFGFRRKRSTTLAILYFVNRITDSIDDGGHLYRCLPRSVKGI